MFARKLDPKTIKEPEITFGFKSSPKFRKDFNAAWNKRKRIKPIKRTRKRQIAKAKHMMACHDQRVMSGHSGGTRQLENRRGGRMMNEEKKALGEYLYEQLENDAYLKELETILTEQFGRKQAEQPYWISNKQLHDLLRFADLLSKSFNKAGSLEQKLRAMAIMDKLKFLYPEHKAIEFFKRSVEAQYNGKPFITELELAKFNRELEDD